MGIFNFLKKKEPLSQGDEKLIKNEPTDTAEELPKETKPNIVIPKRIEDCFRIYFYKNLNIQLYDASETILNEMANANDWVLTPVKTDDHIDLLYHETPFGILSDKVDMVTDWLKRKDPLFVVLQNVGPSGNFVSVAFYRNEEKRFSSHESTVVKLIRYANDDAQLYLSGLEPGEKLDLEEDFDRDDTVNVLCGGEIGSLPKKQSKRYLEEGCAGVFLDHIDTDDNLKDIPYVKIYW